MVADVSPQNDVYRNRFVLRGPGEDARCAQESVLTEIERRSYDSGSCFGIRLALEEALRNAFQHGNRNDPRKQVTMDCHVDEHVVQIDVIDEGEGFDVSAVPDPTCEENLEIPSGRGIVLMRSFMTEVTFEPPGNQVRMKYVRTGA